nr:MAG TPA: hypothetical protein [Caudoviricetes sp.]DAO69238.1 MAG TPA: hypothetical protein [Caudoviricetes sp.]DAR35440.1 MAG TPA: hypothetical protein [Caudoviricetes sp.]DAX32814.1 MAG TPA: hypothetical protein [Caudoviricetes sp.]
MRLYILRFKNLVRQVIKSSRKNCIQYFFIPKKERRTII